MAVLTIEKEKRKKQMLKVEIICGVVAYFYLLLVYLHSSAVRRNSPRISFFESINMSLFRVFTNPFEIFPIKGDTLMNMLLFTAGFMTIGVIMVMEKSLKKHDNSDTVNGEAHLMTSDELDEYNLKFSAPLKKPQNDGFNNMIISKDIRLAIDNRGTRRNCNILVIGGSGAGKSRFFAAPNILQYNCNFVITDPSGELLRDYGKALENFGYEVKVFNLTDVYRSNRYNPFHYIKEEKDVFTLVNTLIKNTTPEGKNGGDPFWENSEKLLLTALILYLWHKVPEPEQTFTNVVKLVTMAEVDENDATAKSPLDELFDDLEKEDPNNLAIKQYKKFKIGAGKTLKSILISVGVRLQSFDLADIQYLTEKDDFEFERFSDTKQALFVIIPTADTTFNFLVSLLYSQLFTSLYTYAETRCEFGWAAQIDKWTNLKVEQANGPSDKDNAKARLEKWVSDVKKGTRVFWDDEKKLFYVYARHTLTELERSHLEEEYYFLAEKVPEGEKSRPYIRDYTGYAFPDKKSAELYIKLNRLDAEKVCVSKKPQKLTEKLLSGFYKKNLMRLEIKKISIERREEGEERNGTIVSSDLADIIIGMRIGWRGTKNEAKAFVDQLKNIKIEKCGARCPNHVRLILDEFANIGQIPDFNEKLATMRKYEISCSIILQALSQLKDIYKDKWNTIVANCDTKLFLGCDDSETIEWMLKMLGKKTTTVENTSWQQGGQGSTSLNKSSLELLTIDQISMMQDDECLVRIRGVRPHYGKKFELTEHHNYKSAIAEQGNFVIPLSPDYARRETGPLLKRQNNDVAIQEAKAIGISDNSAVQKSENTSTQVHSAPRKPSDIKNMAKKQASKSLAGEIDKCDNFKAEDSEEMIGKALEEALGFSQDATIETIKETVDTIVELLPYPQGDLIYAATD